MSDNRSSSGSGGIGFFSLLGIIFITLKLCGVIDWSWWLVLLPLYGPLAAVLLIVAVVLAVMALATLIAFISETLLQSEGKR